MSQIRAVVVDPDAPGRLSLQEVDAPSPLPSEALVKVKAVSLNLGEVRRSTTAEKGWRPGWDLSGVVEQPAADGSGPAAGARVVGFLPSGSWAEKAAVPTHSLAALPDSVSFGEAATLPVAGLTALYALERGGPLLQRRVLITGASGGVGHFACQLAHLGGAYVAGVVRRAELVENVRNSGAHEVVVGEDSSGAAAFGPYDTILESVGGKSLSASLTLLAPRGTCVLFGTSAGSEVTFEAAKFYPLGGATLYGFILFHEVRYNPAADGLKRLADLVAAGDLHPHIDVEASWTRLPEMAQQLWNRKISGKAVLHFE